MKRMTKAERRKQILQNAVKVFAEKGLDGSRTNDIAKACKINEALIYKHFKSKEELFIEAIKDAHQSIVESWKDIIDQAPDSRTALLNILTSQIDTIFADKIMCGCILQGLTASIRDPGMRE